LNVNLAGYKLGSECSKPKAVVLCNSCLAIPLVVYGVHSNAAPNTLIPRHRSARPLLFGIDIGYNLLMETITISPKQAAKRLESYLHRTPILSSKLLNNWLGHEIYFKAEALQKIGAFKARGALNTLLRLKEEDKLPQEIVSFSSGNHAQGVAFAAKTMGIKATVLMPEYASKLKQQATQSYGANLVLCKDRPETELRVKEFIDQGMYFIHPYKDPMVIEGQGSACYEALEDLDLSPSVIVAPCGGGGLLSGTYLAAQELSPNSQVIGCEPEKANDAAQSLRKGEIVKFDHSPDTIADGVMTLAIGEINFEYLKKLDAFLELSEEKIIYWTQWLTHLLKINVEPSSALAMAAAYEYLQNKKAGQRVLVILSGGNVSTETHQKIWAQDYLCEVPRNGF
jgi:threo-3-hydroxy-L-aspartate ammonia-lyase